jgi:23S rRNA pseudouridine2605 synthase
LKKTRLHKAIADAGESSRRGAEKLIAAGRVKVNNVPVTEMGVLVDPKIDIISIDGIPISSPSQKRAYLLYKPVNIICSRDDPEKRQTVFDLIPQEVAGGLHTAGRLDYDAEGLIILTNDGDLTHHLTHPRGHVPKVYLVRMRKKMEMRDLKEFRNGVKIDRVLTLPAEIAEVRTDNKKEHWYRIVLREGRKNQLKRMAQKLDNEVRKIIRVQIGPVKMPERMKPGSFRRLKKNEIDALKRSG